MRAVLIAFLFAVASTFVPPPSNVAPSLETTVTIEPSSVKGYPLIWHDPPTYTCSALVTGVPEEGSRRSYGYGGVRDLVVGPGQKKTMSKSGGGYNTELTVKISATGDRADAIVTLREGTRILTRQHSTVWLDRNVRVRPAQ
jgi:hypothetical protein